MAKPYDVTTKMLIEFAPEDWLRLIGIENAVVEIIDADVSILIGDGDKAMKVSSPEEIIAQLEIQSSYDDTLPLRKLIYSVVLIKRHGLPVKSAVILLRPEADGPAYRKPLEFRLPNGKLTHYFDFDVIRLWELPVEVLLEGGLATLPLAPLAKFEPDRLPEVMQCIEARLGAEATVDQEKDLRAGIYVLMGMKYQEAFIAQIMKGVEKMKESVTYQKIWNDGRLEGEHQGRIEGEHKGRIEGEHQGRIAGEHIGRLEGEQKGRIEGELNLLIRVGRGRLGTPSEAIIAKLNFIDSVGRIEAMADKIFSVETWDELLATDAAK